MNLGTLTTANSVITFTVAGLYDTPQTLTGYATDDVFDFDNVTNAELMMGIDGVLSAGWVANPMNVTLTLQANSDSLALLEEVVARENTDRAKYAVSMTVTLPGVGKRRELSNGYINGFKAPKGGKVLQPGVVSFSFGKWKPSNIGS
jgi:hypothetical protein